MDLHPKVPASAAEALRVTLHNGRILEWSRQGVKTFRALYFKRYRYRMQSKYQLMQTNQ